MTRLSLSSLPSPQISSTSVLESKKVADLLFLANSKTNRPSNLHSLGQELSVVAGVDYQEQRVAPAGWEVPT